MLGGRPAGSRTSQSYTNSTTADVKLKRLAWDACISQLSRREGNEINTKYTKYKGNASHLSRHEGNEKSKMRCQNTRLPPYIPADCGRGLLMLHSLGNRVRGSERKGDNKQMHRQHKVNDPWDENLVR